MNNVNVYRYGRKFSLRGGRGAELAGWFEWEDHPEGPQEWVYREAPIWIGPQLQPSYRWVLRNTPRFFEGEPVELSR